MSLINDLKRNLVNAEELGNTEWAKALKGRIKDEEAREEKTLGQMTKDELLAEASVRGVEVDASAKKADILSALEEGEE